MWAAAADHAAARIAAGELAPGARLPGEHEMATEYRVSTDTIRRAGRAAGRGLVATLAAKATYIAGD